MISFSKSKNKRIFKKILLIFLNIINLLRKLILNYWIYNEFECKIFEFIDIKFINIIFWYKLLKSCIENWDLSLNKKYIYYIYYIFEIDYWSKSSNSWKYKDI